MTGRWRSTSSMASLTRYAPERTGGSSPPAHTSVQGRGINAFFRQYVEQQAVAQLKLLHDRRGQFGGIVVAAFHKQRGLVLVHGDFGRGGPR